MKTWLWCASCPCGYQSAWHRYEWFARLLTYFHAAIALHRRGTMTVAACDLEKVQAKVSPIQWGGRTQRAADAPTAVEDCNHKIQKNGLCKCGAFRARR